MRQSLAVVVVGATVATAKGVTVGCRLTVGSGVGAGSVTTGAKVGVAATSPAVGVTSGLSS